ncbi:MAG: MFS transporter [Myxococcota bacterium]|nr:MFS transporter [Myxococcota bacterium]
MSTPPNADSTTAPVIAKRPKWLLPILGPVPPLEEKHYSLLLGISLALMFEEYDLAMLTAALPQIAETLSMAEVDFGFYLGMIRLGAIPALALIPYADRIGRRRVFLISLIGTAIATTLTAFAQTPTQFVTCQMITRTFFVTGSSIAFVFIAEEFPAPHRGWGIGMLGALGSTGHGTAMGIFSQIEHLPYGWRSLYMIGVVPILLFPFFRKRIPETERFERHQSSDAKHATTYSIVPLFDMFRTAPARAIGVAIAGFLPSVGLVGAFQFTGYFAQTVHGWSPGQYAAMVFFGGGLGIAGNVVAGHLADRFGRRIVGIVLLCSVPFSVALFYLGPGWAITFGWIGFLFGSQGGRVILRAMSAELFPTEHRASAMGLWTILDALGGATGLFLLYFARPEPGDFAMITSALSIATAAGAFVLVFFPETSQRELEAITH